MNQPCYVAVWNTSRQVYLATRAEVADSFVRRGIGLIGRADWSRSDGLVIRPCRSIHTFFMRLPIDVVHVGGDGTVCHVVPTLRPWRPGPIVLRSQCVIELPAGTVERTGTQVGDLLVVESL